MDFTVNKKIKKQILACLSNWWNIKEMVVESSPCMCSWIVCPSL